MNYFRGKRLVLIFSLLSVGILFSFTSCKEKLSPPADLVLLNGNIITVNEDQPEAEAVAIRGERIVKVGDNEEVKKLVGEGTKVIDLGGKTVVPGLIDAHLHFMSYGNTKRMLDLVGTESKKDIQKLVADKVKSVSRGKWIMGRGWDQNDWPERERRFPSRYDLDKVARRNPVVLTRIDGHAYWVNSVVIKMAGITKNTPDPPGGKILRDEKGEPTGVFVDAAMGLVNSFVPRLTYEDRREDALIAMKECLSLGLTSIHDPGVGLEEIKVYKDLIDSGEFDFRAYVMIDGFTEAEEHYLKIGPEVGYGGNRLTVRSFKLFADGALGSRGAAFFKSYSDDPGNFGLLTYDPEKAYQLMVKALNAGFQVNTHAIGTKGNAMTLDLYERAFAEVKVKDPRFRIEHAQVVRADDIPRFAKLGVLASMQPTHATSDMYWAENRVGPERVKYAYAWRRFLDAGVIIPGGSDAPVESPNPLWGIYSAVTRQDHKGWPKGGWYPEQCVSREEALKMFTIKAAYAAFEEKIKGSIEKGKLADLVVLEKDIMIVPAEELWKVKVLATIFGGKVVYQAPEARF
jgi:predicted amidohydrolase YtcJ